MPNEYRARLDPYLTSCEHTRHFADDRLIATQVRRAIEDKADVETKVVAFIVPAQFGRKAYDLTLLDIANDKPSA